MTTPAQSPCTTGCGPASATNPLARTSTIHSDYLVSYKERVPCGPEGHDAGQVYRLTPEQLEQLQHARAAFVPGQKVDNPTLNEFGNHILEVVGRQRFLDLRSDPARLATELGATSDLDGDGIPDARELLDGTHPLKPRSGDAWLLLLTNLRRNYLELTLILLATVLGLYGLSHPLRGFTLAAGAARK